jgi:hypothetical protein
LEWAAEVGRDAISRMQLPACCLDAFLVDEHTADVQSDLGGSPGKFVDVAGQGLVQAKPIRFCREHEAARGHAASYLSRTAPSVLFWRDCASIGLPVPKTVVATTLRARAL